mgnify:CR=1 FL=1
MKKKWTALKRRWKKLMKFDRRSFRMFGLLIAINMVFTLFSFSNIINTLWLAMFVWAHIRFIQIRRHTQMLWYWRGRNRQVKLNEIAAKQILAIAWNQHKKNIQLNSDYKKLEYDYNQLKKSINPKKKKK